MTRRPATPTGSPLPTPTAIATAHKKSGGEGEGVSCASTPGPCFSSPAPPSPSIQQLPLSPQPITRVQHVSGAATLRLSSSGGVTTTRKKLGGLRNNTTTTDLSCHHHYCQKKRQEERRREKNESAIKDNKNHSTRTNTMTQDEVARREDLRSFALIAHEAQRWEDMAEALRTLVRETGTLVREDQYLLSLAYKNLVQPARNAYHTISSLLPTPANANAAPACESNEASIRRYREKIEAEVQGVCEEVIALLRPFQAVPKQDPETLIFIHKMQGDYHRYMAEVTSGVPRLDAERDASRAYSAGWELAKKALAGGSPLRLGLALNYSVFCYHLLDQPTQAISIAQAAADVADVGLAVLTREDKEESSSMRGVLLSNVREWKAERQHRLKLDDQEQRRRAAENEQRKRRREEEEAKEEEEKEKEKDREWRSLCGDGIDLLPPGLSDLLELGE